MPQLRISTNVGWVPWLDESAVSLQPCGPPNDVLLDDNRIPLMSFSRKPSAFWASISYTAFYQLVSTGNQRRDLDQQLPVRTSRYFQSVSNWNRPTADAKMATTPITRIKVE